MQITRLRLLGFKSFVEPTELIIGPGLTGVVGPNGCGKSNLLEALRWVMGETSYKSMRASAMDDVIFSGTDKRPARNMAEVMVAIDNSKRTAPAAFNDDDVLEISRRIQREAGSIYKVNGKEARAKDVQILFADAATGARSRALVQQGQIGQLINAKPQERRRILEDAAGIAGLYSRRHEAEMRLKAAEANLERLRDVIGQIGTQLANLRKQARQAQKYKELTAELRKLEAIQHYQQYSSANAAVQSEEAQLMDSLRAVGQLTQAEAAALRVQAENADALEPLREEEATRAAVLHRIQVERETLDREEKRALEREAELKARLVQIQNDAEREDQAIAEAREILARFDREEEAIKEQGDGSEGRAEAAARAEAMLEALNDADAALSAAHRQRGGTARRPAAVRKPDRGAQCARKPVRRAGSRNRPPARGPSGQKRGLIPGRNTARGDGRGRSPARKHRGRHRPGRGNRRAIAYQGEGYARRGGSGAAQGEEPGNRGRDPHQDSEAGRGGPLQAHRGPNLGDAGL